MASRMIVMMATVVVVGLLHHDEGRADIRTFSNDLAGYAAAAGDTAVAIDFDDIPAGTDIGGTTVSGVAFVATGAPLVVVPGAQTVTVPGGFTPTPETPEDNVLWPTTGAMVLSPGGAELGPGPDPEVENDDVELIFDEPVRAFALDHLSQSADGWSFTTIVVYDEANNAVCYSELPISSLCCWPDPAGAADFWGIVADAPIIKRITIDEYDGDNNFPDCNIGYDSIRYSRTPPVAVESEVVTAQQPLVRCFPNPFNPQTTVRFLLPAASHATLAIYDARGGEVVRLVDESRPAGAHTVDWTGRDAYGRALPSGTYFCRLTTSWGVETRKLQLVR